MAILKKRTVTLQNPLHRRGIHTEYLPDDSAGKDDAGNAKKHLAIPFLHGRAEVDETTARQLRDRGSIK